MKKEILLITLILYSMNVLSQKDLIEGSIVTMTNDTIIGRLKSKNYSQANGVRLYTEKNTYYSRAIIKEINVNDSKYVKSENGIWFTRFFKKVLTGSVNVYASGNRTYLGAYDVDLNLGSMKGSVKLYCDDYPNLKDTLAYLNKVNIIEFTKKYNNWKRNNPNSKSYFENNIHTKNLLNFKISFLQPGAGIELGLSDKFTLNGMLKNELGYNSSSSWSISPYLDTQLRYYHNIEDRKKNNKRTYKYSGNYFCLVHVLFFDDNKSYIGLEYGWQRTIGKHWYYNLGLGAGKRIDTNGVAILCDFDFGFNL